MGEVIAFPIPKNVWDEFLQISLCDVAVRNAVECVRLGTISKAEGLLLAVKMLIAEKANLSATLQQQFFMAPGLTTGTINTRREQCGVAPVPSHSTE